MKFFLYGGCVTRDIFRIAPEDDIVGNYFARTSIISQMSSEPLNVRDNDINLKSKFQKRMIMNDLNKTFIKTLNKSDSDFIIIDFLVERLNLFNKGNAYFTRSSELAKSGLENSKKYNLGKIIYRNDDSLLDIWEDACSKFIDKLTDVFPNNRIILHKVFWSDKYKNSNGEQVSFEPKKLEEIKFNNKMLAHYYKYFEENCKGCNVIGLENKGQFIADEKHQWGLNPMHYEEGYYLEMREQLNNILSSVL